MVKSSYEGLVQKAQLNIKEKLLKGEMMLKKFWDSLGSGQSTAVEHMPAEQNSRGLGFNSRPVLAVFLQ